MGEEREVLTETVHRGKYAVNRDCGSNECFFLFFFSFSFY